MKARDGRLLTGNETDGFGALTRGIQVSPKRLRSGSIMNIKVLFPVAFEREDYVLIFHDLGPERRGESGRRTTLQELGARAQAGIICILQDPEVKISKCSSPSSCVLSFRSGNAENKCRIIPDQKMETLQVAAVHRGLDLSDRYLASHLVAADGLEANR